MKLAIIDSGIDLNSVKYKENINIYEELNQNGVNDEHGHGTMCVNTIQDKLKDVLIVPIKIFDKYGSASSEHLKKTLEKLIDYDIDIICIPASFYMKSEVELIEINKILRKLYKKNKLVIASASNNSQYENISLPAISKYVIGTKCSENMIEDSACKFDFEKKIQFEGCGRLILTKSINNKLEFFGNNSRTCILAAICFLKERYYFKEFQNYNYCFVNSLESDNHILKIKKYIITEIEKMINIEAKELIEKYGLINNITGFGKHNLYNFIIKLEKKFNVKLTDLYFDQFSDIDVLSKIIYNKINAREG